MPCDAKGRVSPGLEHKPLGDPMAPSSSPPCTPPRHQQEAETHPLDTLGPQQTLPIFSRVSPGLVGECHKQNSSDSSGFQLLLFIPHLCHTCTLDTRTPQAPYDMTCSCLQGSHKDYLQGQCSFHFPAVNMLNMSICFTFCFFHKCLEVSLLFVPSFPSLSEVLCILGFLFFFFIYFY